MSNPHNLIYIDEIWNYQVVRLHKEQFYDQIDLLGQVLPCFFSQDNWSRPKSSSSLVAHMVKND